MTSPKVTKRRRALREGRLLRNASGHIVKDPTHDPGVVLALDRHPDFRAAAEPESTAACCPAHAYRAIPFLSPCRPLP